MKIEEYAKYVHFYEENVPGLLLKYLNKSKWKTFLDAGCGDGSLLYALDKKDFFHDKEVYAIDLSKKRIDRCQENLRNINFFVNSAMNIKSINDNSIDFLVSTQVIEHVSSDDRMIEEIARVLNKKNNTVYISTVFKKWYGWYFYRCNNKWTLDPTHAREYTSDEQLFKILHKYGLTITETRKSLFWFSISHFFLRKIGYTNKINNKYLKSINSIKLPIIGYYNWEIICKI